MRKFTVHFMTPFCSYEGVEAEDEDGAIDKYEMPAEFDTDIPFTFVVSEECED